MVTLIVVAMADGGDDNDDGNGCTYNNCDCCVGDDDYNSVCGCDCM